MSSTTPTPPPSSLTERRKTETRMEIARAAAGLFVRHGLRATRAEDIAQAAGIAPRTFYRYFATKEEAVAPLYAAGAQRWVEAVRAAPTDAGVLHALEQGVRHTLTPGVGVSASSWEWVRTLLRLAEATPSLRRVWAEVCQASERLLGEVLAERVTRVGVPGVAGVPGASGVPGAGVPGASGVSGVAGVPGAAGVPGVAGVLEAVGVPEAAGVPEVSAEGRDNVASEPDPAPAATPHVPPTAPPHPPRAATPELRFAAAVASAAVRAALEAWAAGDAPVEGPDGPAELALRNLAALRDFPWGP
ncbi:TetR family transcriptional regulator [Streptomyces massasporeus]|uniref:TetR family transcriptional regulator n=1 Tax=Streptomyces massasporeus TaxID=67324 RepID=UPI001E5EFDA4|nr:TetR family transcriptional regulator [Streptomyces massasporeus]